MVKSTPLVQVVENYRRAHYAGIIWNLKVRIKNTSRIIGQFLEIKMLINSKTIHSEMMKNDTQGFDESLTKQKLKLM